jgi:AsmA protein
MKKIIRLVLLITAALIILCFLALLIIPRFVDVQKYKPVIEQKVSKATGRPFILGGDLRLSLFPWTGLALSDVRLGSPPGFKERDFVSVESFEFQVKLLPLLFKYIQVKRFVLVGPRIVLEKSKDGRGNWEGLGKVKIDAPAKPEAEEKVPGKKGKGGLPIESLVVGTFTIKNGNILWIDHARGQRRELKDLNLSLDEISLEKPIHLSLSALVEGKPFSMEGKLGPIGKKPGEGLLTLDVSAKVVETMDLKVQGQVSDALTRPSYDLNFHIEPFSPRKLATAFGKPPPVTPSDPDALKRLALKGSVHGNAQALTLKDGALELDDSKIGFSANLKEFSKPNVTFDLKLDQIDLDRYLPASQDKSGETKAAAPNVKKTDYTALRKLILDGRIHIDKLKVKNARVQDLDLKIRGRGGIIDLDPLTMRLYDGGATSKITLDVRQNTPATNLTFHMNGIEARPLIKDLINKDFLEGNMHARLDLAMMGDSAEKVKSALNGKGEFRFNDGAIVGIDLAGMIRNIQSAFGKEKFMKKPRTDFAELHAPFTITNGVFNTLNTTLLNPFLRVLAKGKADLLNETLDLRVEPKFVATMEGQGGKVSQSGVAVPVLVTGTFSSPQFRPDLESIIKGRLKKELPDSYGLQEALEDQQKKEDDSTSVQEKAKRLLERLPIGK